jgi:DNA polymerase-2
VDQSTPGLVPQTLQPLLDKRIALKHRIADLPRWDPRRKRYKARAAAHKWLLVTCFGYLGYKNARFGRIEAHQAVTAYSRECLLRAKEAAEDLGYTILHMYVDGLWVQRQGASHLWKCDAPAGDLSVEDVQPLLDEIIRRTGLPIALEGIYRWVAFLPSLGDARVPVANRYFGVFQDGSLKLRGLEARRGETPPFIAAVQMGLLERLARSVAETAGLGQAAQAGINDPGYHNFFFPYPDPPIQLHPAWPEILAYLRHELRRLRSRRLPLEELLVTQKLSRTLDQYRSPSPAARAAAQLAAIGKSTRPGQSVRFLYLRGKCKGGAWLVGGSPHVPPDPPLQATFSEDVHAWDCPPAPPPERLDIERYTALFMRACAAVLGPFGLSEEELRIWLIR